MRRRSLDDRPLGGAAKLEVDFSEIPKIFDELVRKQEKEKESHGLTVNNVLKKLIELCDFFKIDDPNPDKLIEFACHLVDDEIKKRVSGSKSL